MKIDEIKMGMEIRDVVTDTVGHITAVCRHISGYTQFVVQQRVKSDGTLPEAFALDWQAFEKVSDGVMDKVTPPEACSFRLGDKVKDKDTGLVGNITRLWTYINGCVFAHVALPAKGNFLTGKEAVDGIHVGIVRLEAVKPAAEPVKPKRTSGPATRSPRL